MADAASDQQINLPSLVVILVLSGLVLRYFFFSPSSSSSAAAAAARGSGGRGDPVALMRAREAAVERIQQMFPQVDRRAALWDLQRTGGSVAATTERILAGRLETVSFLSISPLHV
jgi:coupling of ubiquitin conjugation to ER degradation protein 1